MGNDERHIPAGAVLAELRIEARKLLWTRAAEAAAVTAGAGGLTAAALQVAWFVAPRSVTVAGAMGALPVLLGLAAMLPSACGVLRCTRRLSIAVAAILVAGGAAGIGAVLAGADQLLPALALPVIGIGLGGVVGVVVVVASGVSLQEAAVFLDVRFKLGERLSTAAELADSQQSRTPFAAVVDSQAWDALQGSRPHKRPFWKRTRATAGALTLIVLLCAAVAFLPGPSTQPGELDLAALAEDFQTMQPPEQQELARRLLDVAELAAHDPELLAALTAAATAAGEQEVDQLTDALGRARRALLEAGGGGDDIAKALALAVGQGDADSAAERATARQTGPAGERPEISQTSPAGQDDLVRWTHVWDPQYAQHLASHDGPEDANAVESPAEAPAPAGLLPYDAAWRAARQRAAQALDRGQVPPRCRELVKAYFLPE